VGFLLAPRSWIDTLAFPIINALHTNVPKRMPAVNMLNNGAIANLPPDVFVEGPAHVDSTGCRLLSVGGLPRPLAAFCRRDIEVCEMTVEAAVSGERRLVLQAMLLDPVIDSVANAENVFDAMLKANADYLPQFS
jgi:alpha-galactosidase